MKNTRMTMLYGICMICLVATIMPAASALGNGTSWNDNPEHITAMQAHVAYTGTISNGAGTGQLSSLESQFAGTETSVQAMTTADQIKAAETQMSADRK